MTFLDHSKEAEGLSLDVLQLFYDLLNQILGCQKLNEIKQCALSTQQEMKSNGPTCK